jgi:hypothetical protein
MFKGGAILNKTFIKVIAWLAVIGMIGGTIATIIAPLIGN